MNFSTKRIQEIDDELNAAGHLKQHRPLECFKRLYGNIIDSKQRAALFEPIIAWYIGQYGNSMQWDGVIGYTPVMIRNEVYLSPARFVAVGELHVDWKSEIEDLPAEIANSVDLEEFRSISERLSAAYSGWKAIYNLHIEDDWLSQTERDWVHRGYCDLRNVSWTLKKAGDTQTAIFQSHQAAEKFLKAALRKSGSPLDPEKFSHRIPQLFRALVDINRFYRWLAKPVENLDRLASDRNLRYRPLQRSMDDSVLVFHGAMYICGAIADMWLFDKARAGTEAAFREGHFYRDRSRATFHCKGIQKNMARLTYFHSDKTFGAQLAELTVSTEFAPIYLEVSDKAEEQQLRRQLIFQLRNPGRVVTPEEVGLRSVDSNEGSYTTAMLRKKVESGF